MNNPEKMQYPEWMNNDNDIAIYDQMIAIGRLQVGKEIGKNEEYLLHLSAILTLKQLKGLTLSLDSPEVAELKRIHLENFARDTTFTTPESDFYASALALKEPYLSPEVEEQINNVNILTSNLVLDEVKKTSNIADEPIDNDIKEGYVKVITRPEPEPVVVEAPEAP